MLFIYIDNVYNYCIIFGIGIGRRPYSNPFSTLFRLWYLLMLATQFLLLLRQLAFRFLRTPSMEAFP